MGPKLDGRNGANQRRNAFNTDILRRKKTYRRISSHQIISLMCSQEAPLHSKLALSLPATTSCYFLSSSIDSGQGQRSQQAIALRFLMSLIKSKKVSTRNLGAHFQVGMFTFRDPLSPLSRQEFTMSSRVNLYVCVCVCHTVRIIEYCCAIHRRLILMPR